MHATGAVRDGFTAGNVLARTLDRFPGQLTWRELPLHREVELDAGLAVRAVPAPGKPPIHLEGLTPPAPGDNVALLFRDLSTGARLAYAPAVARTEPALLDALDGVAALFFDGTFWSDDELPSLGLGERRAADMAHLPVSQSLRALSGVRARRRVLIHVNNTEPPSWTRLRASTRSWCAPAGRSRGTAWRWRRERARSRRLRRAAPGRGRGPLPRPPPVSPTDERGRALRRRAAPLGPEPLVLPDPHPGEGRAPPREERRPGVPPAWIRRIHDHDGEREGEGGLALWLRLAAGVGLDVEEVRSCRRVLPGVRFACDAYVDLVRRATLVEAVASSLTEVFAPDLMARRIAAWERHYPWVDPSVLAYFRSRVPRARRDGEEALAFVVAHATTAEAQEACVRALVVKTEVLWHLLDCVELGA